jgi:uncharacterized protein YndB with AHSA1/START domain
MGGVRENLPAKFHEKIARKFHADKPVSSWWRAEIRRAAIAVHMQLANPSREREFRMNANASWSKTYSHDIDDTAQAVWQALTDAANWRRWNPGVKSIQMEGSFATGTWFAMELPDGEVIRSKLIDVRALQRFIDETWVGETVVRVEHRVEALQGNRCRVVYAVNAEGADAQAIGDAVSADFPDVLAGLAKYLGERTA